MAWLILAMVASMPDSTPAVPPFAVGVVVGVVGAIRLKNRRDGLRLECLGHFLEIEPEGAAAEADHRDSPLPGEPPDLRRCHLKRWGEFLGGREGWWCLQFGVHGLHHQLRSVTFARMNPRTLRRHRERERMGLPVPGYRKDENNNPLPKLGRPAGETAKVRDAFALEFCEAVFAALEEGTPPTLEALRQYPRHPEPPGPPVWRKSASVRKRIEAAGIPAQVLLLAVWDLMPSLLVAKARTPRAAKKIAKFKKWAKAQNPAGRAKVEEAAERAGRRWEGFFGEDSQGRLDAIGKELVRRIGEHHSTAFARQMMGTPIADIAGRKHRGAGAVLGMSRRMVCHYRGRPEYQTALALIEGFKKRAHAKFVARGVAGAVDARDFTEGGEESAFDAMVSRLARR